MLFDELKNKYPNLQLSLYGDCIIVPISEYTKEKEKQLQQEGHNSRITDYQFREVWAISLKKTEPYTKEPFPELPKLQPTAKSANSSKPDWTDEEKDRLMKRWVEVMPVTATGKAKELLKEFPGQSEQAIYLIHYELTGGKATHQRKKITEPMNNKINELQEKIVALDLKIGTLESDKEELSNDLDFLKADFKEHQHSKKTGLPLVPP